MDYADKKKMPIDTMKVKDMLRAQHMYRKKIVEDIDTYDEVLNDVNWESGCLAAVNECAWGDLRDLLDDLNITQQSVHHTNLSDIMKLRNSPMVTDTDLQMQNLLKARFTMIDMTEYEYDYPSVNEHQQGFNFIKPGYMIYIHDDMPAKMEFEKEDNEKLSMSLLGKSHRDAYADRKAREEAGDEEEEDEEEEEEDEEGEGEEGGEGAEEEEEEEVEEVDPLTIPQEWNSLERPDDDRYFNLRKDIHDQFNEVELEGFMKILNIKPRT